MSANYLINVPKLTGRDNYGEWCFAAENFLILEGMKHCVKPDAGVEVKTADDEKTKAKLIMTIDPSLYVHVKSVKSSKELWEKLKQLFDDSGFSRRISLLRNLISIRRENCSSMTSYVTQIIDTAQKLSGTGFEINDQWTGSLLLAGLPDRFSPMIMAIEHSGIPITADSIKTKLLDMDLASHSESEIEGAFAIRSNSSNLKFNRRPNKNLSMAGKSNIDNSNTGQVKTNVKQIQCYRCKQIGHYKNQCTNEKHSPMQKTKDRIQSNAFSAVFLSENFKRDDWYIDSGASVHLTANESWVMNAKYEQNKEINVANSEKASVLCCGEVKITTTTDNHEYDIVMKDVMCVPSLTTNLLSFSQLIKRDNSVSFTEDGCLVHNQKNDLVATAVMVNGVYRVNLLKQECLAASVESVMIWHRRLGHVNKDYLNQMPNAVQEKTRCLLFDANLSKEFWAEATNTAVYLQNRIGAATLDNKTPFELWTGSKPDISHIRIFDSTVMVHVAKEKRRKWDKKAVKCILMGYPDNIKGYRVYNPETRNISTSRDVIIIEKESKPEHFIEVQDQDIDSVGECKNPDDTEQQETDSITNNSESSVDSFQDVNDETYVPTDYKDSDSILKDDGNRSPQCLNKRIRKVPDRYGFSNLCVDNETYVDAAGLSLHDALNGPERTQWESAMSEELQCFKDNDAWELSDPPKDGTVVQCKWVLRKKYDSENKVRFRARLVAKGYSQIEGVDFTETFSPVVRHTTLRLLFALSVQLGLSTTHLDVTTAFLNGTFNKTIYMKIPKGFSEKTQNGQVLKLKKAIYGLKQSSRAWYKKVDECLLNMGYVKSKIEPCMFTKMSQGQKTIVTLFVDDFFVFSNDVKETNYLKHALAKGFVDADWGTNTIDRRSYTGVCFTLSGCVISWETRKQKTVALSSSEAEYMAITEACKEAVYLRNLQMSGPPPLHNFSTLPSSHYPLHHPIPLSIRYPIPIQEVSNALVTPPELRVCIDGVDHLLSSGVLVCP
ncbi:Retrovirus-related Pol polyprotein from transposon TNT 1-94 [Eumeta japonica]|uniref:Retrovirus-related Pol polyprotein from transposon TNT 1-94 n=1 Tax=Eumeta variegata TaxID=151549 RepID=A0A4C1YJ07_EUMVA|nr:Retrovirus-related Pol polyprotein from transposon TNT 1-94 [Eumeta japonica]